MASDPTWNELVSVCVRLNKPTEAIEALQRIEDKSLRVRASGLLMRRGLMSKHQTSAHHPDPKQTAHPGSEQATKLASSMSEEVGDSFRFLFIDHMPLTAMVITMIFPVVIGLGGALTAGSNSLLLPLIALIPTLSALGMVGALSRQILLEASHGLSEPPALPSLKPLVKDSWRFLLDGLLFSSLALGPGIIVCQFAEITLGTKIGILAIGCLFLPMAMAARQISDDWRALNPILLIQAISKGGMPYLVTVGLGTLMLAPAVAALILTMGSAAYLQISVIGPLSVVPLFVISRLLGRVLDIRRSNLGELLGMPAQHTTQEVTTIREHQSGRPARRARNKARRSPLNAPTHPETAKQGSWKPKPLSGASIDAVQPDPLGLMDATGSDAQSHDIVGDELPDLTKLPGACVLTGKDRENSGAASSMKQRLR